MNDITIELNHQQNLHRVSDAKLRKAIQNVLAGEGVLRANIRVAIVDDLTIHKANRQHLGHDEPTDVLSFPAIDKAETLDGDIMVSAETAIRQSKSYGWSADEELLLYLVHGTLHLAGYDDRDQESRKVMRERETRYLHSLDIEARYDETPQGAQQQ